jgi:hypothetical protein
MHSMCRACLMDSTCHASPPAPLTQFGKVSTHTPAHASAASLLLRLPRQAAGPHKSLPPSALRALTHCRRDGNGCHRPGAQAATTASRCCWVPSSDSGLGEVRVEEHVGRLRACPCDDIGGGHA